MITLLYVICIFILLSIIYLIYKRVSGVVEGFHEPVTPFHHDHVGDNSGYVACVGEGGVCTGVECCFGLRCMDGTCKTTDTICGDDANYSNWNDSACGDWPCTAAGTNPNRETRTLNSGITVNCDTYLSRPCTNGCSSLTVEDFEFDLDSMGSVRILIKSITTNIVVTDLTSVRLVVKIMRGSLVLETFRNIGLAADSTGGGTIITTGSTAVTWGSISRDDSVHLHNGALSLNVSFDEVSGHEKSMVLNHLTNVTFLHAADYKDNSSRFIKITGFETLHPLSSLGEYGMKVRVYEQDFDDSAPDSGFESLGDDGSKTLVTDAPVMVKSGPNSELAPVNAYEVEIPASVPPSTALYGRYYSLGDIVETDPTDRSRQTALGYDKKLYVQLPEREKYVVEFHLIYNGFVTVLRGYVLRIDARGCNNYGESCESSGCCVNADTQLCTNWYYGESTTEKTPTCKTEPEICGNDNNYDWAECPSWNCGSPKSKQVGSLRSDITDVRCPNKERDCIHNGCTALEVDGRVVRIKVQCTNESGTWKYLDKNDNNGHVGFRDRDNCRQKWKISFLNNFDCYIQFQDDNCGYGNDNHYLNLDQNRDDCYGSVNNLHCDKYRMKPNLDDEADRRFVFGDQYNNSIAKMYVKLHTGYNYKIRSKNEKYMALTKVNWPGRTNYYSLKLVDNKNDASWIQIESP